MEARMELTDTNNFLEQRGNDISGAIPEEDTRDEVIGRSVNGRERHSASSPTPLAFSMNGNGKSPQHRVVTAHWSSAALGHLGRLEEMLRNQHPRVQLPVVGLRGRLELADQSSLRLDRNVGLKFDKKLFNQSPTLLWTQTEETNCLRATNEAVLGWLVDDVTQHALTETAQHSLAQLKNLARSNAAIEVMSRICNPYHWDVTRGKTAKPVTPTSYPDLADYVVRHLEGKILFPELPRLRRIASGNLDMNAAELMTEPISVGRGESFSLVVRVRILSYPGRPVPLIVVEFSKRIWTKKLKDTFSAAMSISGFAFPPGSTRALRFTLRKIRGEDGTRTFQTDADFAPIERAYFPGAKLTVANILKNGHRMPECTLLVALKHGTGERAETKSGVPDLDKMDALQNITTELSSIGLVPWHGLDLIDTSTQSVRDNGQAWRKRDSERDADQKRYSQWLKEAQESIRACYSGEHHIVIAVQQMPGVEDDGKRAEECLKEILQGSVITTRIPIPQNVHGPKSHLPGRECQRPADRAGLRIAEWGEFIQTVKEYEGRTSRKVDGLLVIAHRWYPGKLHDDNVNIRAARIALAVGLGIPVQYVCPSSELSDELDAISKKKPKSADKDESEDFETRLMMGWLDLAFKSLGRVRPSKLVEEARKLYGEASLFHAYPDRVLALGVVRRNESRFLANHRSFLPYAIELDTESGVCTASFAYEDNQTKNLVITDALPLPEALVKLAGLGPIELSTRKQGERNLELKERSQAFFKVKLAEFGKRGGLNPLAIVDSDTCRSVWPWLTDATIEPNNVHLAGGYNAQAAWPNVRLVRIRTGNSPKVLWDGEFCGTIVDTDEIVRYKAPRWAEAQLYKLNDTVNTDVYLSFGSAIRYLVRGTSCYRQILGLKRKIVARKEKFEVALFKTHTDAWATPTGLEICVVRSGTDQPDQVAAMIEWLRQCYPHIGGWTLKPAPIHFEHALKEYIADYELEESDDDNSEED